ncbi:hypothetical protein MRX96_008849 [Rhipicephalus microplus]
MGGQALTWLVIAVCVGPALSGYVVRRRVYGGGGYVGGGGYDDRWIRQWWVWRCICHKEVLLWWWRRRLRGWSVLDMEEVATAKGITMVDSRTAAEATRVDTVEITVGVKGGSRSYGKDYKW